MNYPETASGSAVVLRFLSLKASGAVLPTWGLLAGKSGWRLTLLGLLASNAMVTLGGRMKLESEISDLTFKMAYIKYKYDVPFWRCPEYWISRRSYCMSRACQGTSGCNHICLWSRERWDQFLSWRQWHQIPGHLNQINIVLLSEVQRMQPPPLTLRWGQILGWELSSWSSDFSSVCPGIANAVMKIKGRTARSANLIVLMESEEMEVPHSCVSFGL